MLCFFYYFESLSLDFMRGLFEFILNKKTSISAQMLNHLINLCGYKIRADDPLVLKDLINKA